MLAAPIASRSSVPALCYRFVPGGISSQWSTPTSERHPAGVTSNVGHAEKWDRVDVDGDAGEHDVTVRFMRKDKALAVATIFRDKESLDAETQMERGS